VRVLQGSYDTLAAHTFRAVMHRVGPYRSGVPSGHLRPCSIAWVTQIERVLILADKPVMRRPIAAAAVLDALPKPAGSIRRLCERVGRYLARYTHTSDLHAWPASEGAATRGADSTLPDRYGLHNRSAWDASIGGYLQPGDYLLVSIGAVAYDGARTTPDRC